MTTSTCGICRRQTARYICPQCNVPYCSLECFRSQGHAECSEPFYERTLMAELSKSGPDDQEKREMLKIIQRLAETEEEASEEGDPLAQALQGIDLDSLSAEDVLSRLPPEERSEFQALLQQPAAIDQLLAGLPQSTQDPWWSHPELDNEKPVGPKDLRSFQDVVPKTLPSNTPPSLGWNIAATMLAYAYIYRTTMGFSDVADAQALIQQTLPFLFEKSSVVFGSLAEAESYIRSHNSHITGDTLEVLVDDLANLLRPSLVNASETQDTFLSHRHRKVLIALAALHALLRTSQQRQVARHKVRFYAALVVERENIISPVIMKEVLSRVGQYAPQTNTEPSRQEVLLPPRNEAIDGSESRPKIVELN